MSSYRHYFKIFDPVSPAAPAARPAGATAVLTAPAPVTRRIGVVYLSSTAREPRSYCYETDLPVRIGDLVEVPETELSRRLAPGQPNIARVVDLDADYDGPVSSVVGLWQQSRA